MKMIASLSKAFNYKLHVFIMSRYLCKCTKTRVNSDYRNGLIVRFVILVQY